MDLYAREGQFQPWVSASIDGGNRTVASAPLRLTITQAQSGIFPRLHVEPLTNDLVANKDVELKASLDPPQDDVRYLFQWDDGSRPDSVGIEGLVTHRYARPGRHTVLVTASTVQKRPGATRAAPSSWWCGERGGRRPSVSCCSR